MHSVIASSKLHHPSRTQAFLSCTYGTMDCNNGGNKKCLKGKRADCWESPTEHINFQNFPAGNWPMQNTLDAFWMSCGGLVRCSNVSEGGGLIRKDLKTKSLHIIHLWFIFRTQVRIKLCWVPLAIFLVLSVWLSLVEVWQYWPLVQNLQAVAHGSRA